MTHTREPEDAIGLDIYTGQPMTYDLGGLTKAARIVGGEEPPAEPGPEPERELLGATTYYLAPSLATLRAELNARWPNRDKTSDGWIGDAAHQAGVSQHNPDANGCVHALDIDHDGIDQNFVLRELIGDPRAWYVIHDWTIWSRTTNWMPRQYTGSNGHLGHMHLSILLTTAAETNTTAWLSGASTEEYNMDTLDLSNAHVTPVKGRHVDNLEGLLLATPFAALKGFQDSMGRCDGVAGAVVRDAVGKFQAMKGLTVDYVVGPVTWRALIEH